MTCPVHDWCDGQIEMHEVRVWKIGDPGEGVKIGEPDDCHTLLSCCNGHEIDRYGSKVEAIVALQQLRRERARG